MIQILSQGPEYILTSSNLLGKNFLTGNVLISSTAGGVLSSL